MPTTSNLLPWYNALSVVPEDGETYSLEATPFPYGWEGNNATLSISATDFNVSTRYVLLANPADSLKVTYSLRDVELPLTLAGTGLIFNAKIKTLAAVSTVTTLWIDSASATYFVDPDTNIAQSASSTVSFPIDGHITALSSGQYNAVSSNTAYIPNDSSVHYANIDIEITGHQATPIKMTNPNLIRELGFYENPFVGQMRYYLPDFYWSLDADQEHPSYPFYRLIDILTSAAGDSRLEFINIFGYENGDLDSSLSRTQYWANSTLTNPSVVKNKYIPWLAQFTGENIKQNLLLSNNSPYLDNLGLVRQYLEWQISNSFYGRAAGSRKAVISAIQQVLVKTKDGEASTFGVALTPKFGGNPWAIRVQTLSNETIDADAGDSSNLVLAALEMARPLGYQVSHMTIAAFILTLDDITLGIIGTYPLG